VRKEGWLGRYYEDFEVGDVYRHRLGRTVTETDNTLFTMLTLNTNPIHFDENLARKTPFGKILVNSCFTLSLAVGLSVSDLSEHVMANLGWNDIRLPNPVFIGDTIYASSEILAKRESGSRQDMGIVTARTTGVNQDGKTVISYERTFMVYKHGHDPRDAPLAGE
jgi:acyl dehydratase